MAEAFALHERAGFLAADAAGAEHDDGLLLERVRQAADRGREVAEMVHADGQGVAEGAEADFVVVARVEQRDRPAFVEPLLEFAGGQLGGSAPGGIDALDAERDDLLLEPHQHAGEGLMVGLAVFRRQVREARQGAEFGEEQFNAVRGAGDEQVDALGAEQDRAPQVPAAAEFEQAGAQRAKLAERRELVGGEVDDAVHPVAAA